MSENIKYRNEPTPKAKKRIAEMRGVREKQEIFLEQEEAYTSKPVKKEK